jgi:DNA mismatch repair protein MutS2
MNETTFHKLDFDSVRETLAESCATGLGKSLARGLTPSVKTEVVRAWLTQVQELMTVSQEQSLPPMGGVYDVREHVRASAFPTPLEADALLRIADTLGATTELTRWLTRVMPAAPSLRSLAERISDLSPIADAIREAIDERGQVRDHATPRLATIRSAIDEAKGRIRIVFDRVLRQSSVTKMLQYSSMTFHDDRFVLPLKAEYRGRIQGIVHRSSDSGATLFVEPSESVELNNTIVRLRDEESREITQILQGLSRRVNLNVKEILGTLSAMAVLDLIAAKCRYAKKRSCVCPIIDENGALELHDARHPLLLELFEQRAAGFSPRGHTGAGSSSDTPRDLKVAARQEVVPIDVRLGDDFDVLVITGPNTGGKTVALKTVGLLAMMTQCGIPIPAAPGSKMPVYGQVFIDIGDEQSLQQSLSTFSSHLATLLNIIQGSGPRSLVLIDELGAGTDPDEGAAIGRAVIAELLRLNAKAIVTTHLGALKAVAFNTPRVDNASVEFDPETLKPTFHLRLGEPGNSNALIIAKRLGMPARLVQLAKSYLDNQSRALSQAIAGTLDSRREAEAARRAAREAVMAAQQERDKYEHEKAALERSREEFAAWTQWINALRPGDQVFVRRMSRVAKVVRMQLHRQMALVSAGALDVEVAVSELERPDQSRDR